MLNFLKSNAWQIQKLIPQFASDELITRIMPNKVKEFHTSGSLCS